MAMNKLKKFFKTRLHLQTGFSMLEAVVVVGVFLALTVSGFIAYGSIAENAKKAKVKSTASEIHTAVLVANIDGDPETKPQDVISDWNNSTDKIRVEILEPAAVIAAMSSAEMTFTADGDICVQATNVESPHITARAGACENIDSGSNPGLNPDTDGDGIPDSRDPDIDGDGTPNTVWESFNIVKDKQAAGEKVSYINPDGSKTTWNFADTATYDHQHDPTNPNLLSSGHLDILKIEKTNPNRISVTVGTNGLMNNSTGAVGGSFGVWMHGDLSCKDNATGVTTPRFNKSGGTLQGLYLAISPVPGPNTSGLSFDCYPNETVTSFTLYPDRYVDWSDNPYGGYSFFFTKNQIVNWIPAAA